MNENIMEAISPQMSDKEYGQFIKDSANYLCGFNCGTAVDVIIEYTTRPDLSMYQFN